MAALIIIKVSTSLFVRDPEATELGRKIVGQSIKLLDKIGLEKFTFKKLAREIKSTEASIYRYFRGKGQLMGYLFAWYWTWLEWRMEMSTKNVDDKTYRLKAIISVLTESINFDPDIPHIDERILHRVIVSESDRSLYSNELKSGQRLGGLTAFKALCDFIAQSISNYSPRFKHPYALAQTLLATTHRNRFYAAYFPDANDPKNSKVSSNELRKFLELLTFSSLETAK